MMASRLLLSTSLLVLSLVSLGQGQGQTDMTRVAGSKGTDVVEATVNMLRESCAFPNDHLFLRRLAFVASNDGMDPNTYRLGFEGGIWQVTQNDFQLTKTSALVSKYWSAIQNAFGINWAQVQWSDLRKPLYSGIAAMLTLLRTSAGNLPLGLESQAAFFQKQISPNVVGAAYNFLNRTKNLDIGCATDNIDLAFLVDTSVSLAPQDFQRAKLFASDIVGLFNVGPNAARVAFVTFSTGYQSHFDFNSYTTTADVQNAIQGVSQSLGATNTHLALKYAAEQLFTPAHGSRSNAGRVAIIITDGQSDDRIDTVAQAQALKDLGVAVFVIGVGGEVATQELNSVATSPACTHVQILQQYSELDSLRAEIKSISCEATVTLGAGDYTYPCGQRNTFQIPAMGDMTIIIRPRSGLVRYFASYSASHPNEALRDYESTATASMPAAIYISGTNQPVYLTIASDASVAGQCNTQYDLQIIPRNALRKETNNACVKNSIFTQCSALDILKATYTVTQMDPNRLPFPNPCMPNTAGYYPHPYSLYQFIYCDGQGNIYVVNCQPGYYYRSSARDCVVGPPPTPRPTQAPVTTSRPITARPVTTQSPVTGSNANIDPGNACSVCTADNYKLGLRFFAYAPNDTMYIMCTEYEFVCRVKQCAPYHKWDQLNQACIYSEVVVDWTKEVYQVSPNPNDYLCNAQTRASGIYFHAHPSDNTKYIQCDEFGDVFIKQCPPNEIWNQNIMNCVPGVPLNN